MTVLDTEIAAFRQMESELNDKHPGEWAVLVGDRVEGYFSRFEGAASFAAERFGRGPYLIRQIGAPEIVLPASVVFNV